MDIVVKTPIPQKREQKKDFIIPTSVEHNVFVVTCFCQRQTNSETGKTAKPQKGEGWTCVTKRTGEFMKVCISNLVNVKRDMDY